MVCIELMHFTEDLRYFSENDELRRLIQKIFGIRNCPMTKLHNIELVILIHDSEVVRAESLDI